jgi:hypothetical protein
VTAAGNGPQPRAGSLPDRVAVGMLLQRIPPRLVDEVIAEIGAREQRTRLLPAWLTMYFTLALRLWPQDGYETVLDKLLDGLSWAGQDNDVKRARASSAARARDRLGSEPMRRLFQRLTANGTRRLAGPESRWWRGLPIRPLDSTLIKAPDECGFEYARILAFAEADGALIAAGWAPGTVPTLDLTRRLSHPLQAAAQGSLILAGRVTYELWETLTACSADLLCEALPDPPMPEPLPDGSYLAQLQPMAKRIIPRPDGGELATTLINTYAPEHELIELHADRWRAGNLPLRVNGWSPPVLRSKSGIKIDQEVWALLCVYQALALPTDQRETAHQLRTPFPYMTAPRNHQEENMNST